MINQKIWLYVVVILLFSIIVRLCFLPYPILTKELTLYDDSGTYQTVSLDLCIQRKLFKTQLIYGKVSINDIDYETKWNISSGIHINNGFLATQFYNPDNISLDEYVQIVHVKVEKKEITSLALLYVLNGKTHLWKTWE